MLERDGLNKDWDVSLIFALVLLGFTFVVSQVLLVRELIVTFYGNELSLGIIFFSWLVMVAAGALLSRRLVLKLKRNHFPIIQILISILLPIQIFLARVIKSLIVVKHGVILGIIPIFFSSVIVLAPLCVLIGFQFTLGCRIYAKKRKATEVGDVFVYDAFGSTIGGVTFTYLLIQYLQPFQIAIFIAFLNLFSAFILQYPYKNKSLSIILIILLVFSVSALPSIANCLNDVSSRLQWRGYELIFYEHSIYGNVAGTKTDMQYNFFENGLLIFVAPDPDIVLLEEQIHIPLLLHSMPKKILLIGGGIGGALDEILKHPVSNVHYTELDPLIVQLGRKHISSSALNESSINIEYVDGRLFVKKVEEKFDIVIVNLPPPSTLQLNRYYSLEFFIEIRKILNNDGILSVGVPSSEAYLSKEMKDHNGCVYVTLKEVFPSILVIPGEYMFFLASSSEISYNTETIIHKLHERKIVTKVLTEPYIIYKGGKIENGTELYENHVEVNRDIRPIATYYNMVLWNVMFYPNATALFNVISQTSLWFIILGLSILLVFISIFRRRSIKTSISIVTMTSGFAAMTLSITLLFAFQVAFGYIYQIIAVLVASFMTGLSIGAYSINRMMEKIRRPIFVLAGIALMICTYSLVLIPILSFIISSLEILTMIVFFILNGLVGFLDGLVFPLATKVYLKESGRVSDVAGTIYAVDLVGACVGAILTGVFLVPVLGIPQTCFAVFVLNLVGFIALINIRKVL